MLIIGLLAFISGSRNSWYGAIIGLIGLPFLISLSNLYSDFQIFIIIPFGFLFGKVIGFIGSVIFSGSKAKII